MKIEIQRLIDTGTIICGKIIKEDGIIRFERVDSSQIEDISEDEIGFATQSMGRAIFTIDKENTIHIFKGVNSHLSTSELGLMDLVNAESIEYIPKNGEYKVSAMVFNGKKPEIRINGTSPLEDLEIEGDINSQMTEFGVKVPTIRYIKEIPKSYSIKYGLPITVEGSLDEFKSDYSQEDDKRKKRLKEILGANYTLELAENQRPESMSEYLTRIGFLSSSDVQEKVETLGYSIEDFVIAVDSYYSRGQRYGQSERLMGNPFRISDLEIVISNGNREQLQAIMDFSEMQKGNFVEQFAEISGKNLAMLMNNGWECENLIHRQDFALTGEFCDDAYFNALQKKRKVEEKYKDTPYKAKAFRNELIRKYTGQIMHIASCIKVLQQALEIMGKNQTEIDSLLETFIKSFTNNIDFQQIRKLLYMDEITVVERMMNELRVGQNWAKKMASLERTNGKVIDEAIFNSHKDNNDYYEKVSKMIREKIKNRSIGERIEESKKNSIYGFIASMISKLKKSFNKKNTKMISESKEDTGEGASIKSKFKNAYLAGIKYHCINLSGKGKEKPKPKAKEEDGPSLNN